MPTQREKIRHARPGRPRPPGGMDRAHDQAESAAEKVALPGALGQLLLDLAHVPERDRSPYEAALHAQLVELGHRLGPEVKDGSARGKGGRVVHPRFIVEPASTDTKRVRCDNPDCPNKRM